jgi:hypothetical protein
MAKLFKEVSALAASYNTAMYTANRANWTGLRLRVVSNPDFKMKK